MIMTRLLNQGFPVKALALALREPRGRIANCNANCNDPILDAMAIRTQHPPADVDPARHMPVGDLPPNIPLLVAWSPLTWSRSCRPSPLPPARLRMRMRPARRDRRATPAGSRCVVLGFLTWAGGGQICSRPIQYTPGRHASQKWRSFPPLHACRQDPWLLSIDPMDNRGQ